MRLFPQKHLISHMFMLPALCLMLAGCNMPTEPEGAGVEGMTRIGDQLRTNGDDAGAAEFYSRALQRSAKDTHARQALAEIFEAHGDAAHAEALYSDGTKLDPSNDDFLRGDGRTLLKLGRPLDARDAFEKALQNDLRDAKAFNGLGISLDYLNQHEAAQNAYRSALDIEPGNLATLSNLAHSYTLSGGYDQAIKLLEPYAQDRSAPKALRQNLAEAYGYAGMDADAERMARMDLPPAQVAKNIAWYKSQRVKLSIVPKLYADLGNFATEAMSDARTAEVKETVGDSMDGLIIASKPQVKAIGGTPSFALQVTGFATAAKLRAFCDKLEKNEIECKTVSAM